LRTVSQIQEALSCNRVSTDHSWAACTENELQFRKQIFPNKSFGLRSERGSSAFTRARENSPPCHDSEIYAARRLVALIDFGLEVVEKQSVCGTIFESEFIELSKKLKAHDRLIVTRNGPFCKTPSLESPMSIPSGTR
jgi:hypothetical protein